MPRSDLVQSLTRALTLLELAARREEGVTLRELCRETGLKPPTAHNLARTLVARGFLEKLDRPPRYRLGPAVAALAAAQMSGALLRRAPAVLKGIEAELGGAIVVLAQPIGSEMVKVMRIGAEPAGMAEHARQSMLPYSTASAMLYQAFSIEELRAAYRARYPFYEYGAGTWESEAKFEEALAETRRRGLAVLVLEKAGVVTMSAPVLGLKNEFLAAVGATMPLADCPADKRRHMTEVLLAAARKLGAPA